MGELTEYEQRLAYRFAHLPLPSDAVTCDPWSWHGDLDWRRHFLTREWEIAGIWVSVVGEQTHLGRITRWMHVGGEDECTTSDRRCLIAALEDGGRLLDALVANDASAAGSTGGGGQLSDVT